MSVRLGEILVKESLITQDQLQKALEFQRANGGKLGSCLTRMGFITDDDITAAKVSGLSESQVFEIVVCAAVGQASRQYETALAALKDAMGKE